MNLRLRNISQRAVSAVEKYPAVLAVAFIAAISAITYAEFTQFRGAAEERFFGLIKMIVTALLGISLFFAAAMAGQRYGKKWLWEVCAVLILAVFYFALPANEIDFTDRYVFVIFPAFILSHLLVAVVPYFRRGNENKFWHYNKNLFINIFLTGIFTGVLTGGLVLALLATDKLFDLDIPEYRFGQLAYFCGMFGSAFIFLLFNGNGLKSLERDEGYPQILKFFTQFVLIPLLIVYAIILYFYAGKILIQWELPRGWVSYLILAYSVVGIFAQLLVHPVKIDGQKSWVRIFSRIFYYSLLALLVLLFVAIKTRILEYGFTEARYYVMLLAIWLAFIVLYFIFNKKASIKIIPLSLLAAGLFGLLAPYLNAYSIAVRSQKNELNAILNSNNLLQNDTIIFRQNVEVKVVDEIANKFEFLAIRNQGEYLKNLLPTARQQSLAKAFSKNDRWEISRQIRGFFGTSQLGEPTYSAKTIRSRNAFIEIKGYDFAVDLQSINGKGQYFNGDLFTFKMINPTNGTSPQKFTLTLNNDQSVDLSNTVFEAFKNADFSEKDAVTAEIAPEFDLGNYHVKFVLQSISKSELNKRDQYYLSGWLLVKIK